MKYLAVIGAFASLASLVWVILTFTRVSNYESTPPIIIEAPIVPDVASSTDVDTDTEDSQIKQEPNEVETPKPTPPPAPPQGARWHNLGGIARANCQAIANPEIRAICEEEVVLERYIKTIVPSASITKGFCYPGTAFDDPKNWQQCTDLNNLKTPTVRALKAIFENIVRHCSQRGIADCAIIVTGGSEFGHKGEVLAADGSITCVDPESHCGGKKIDLRLTDGLESLIETTMTPLPRRDFDNAPQWQDPETGFVYAREPTHWDILVP